MAAAALVLLLLVLLLIVLILLLVLLWLGAGAGCCVAGVPSVKICRHGVEKSYSTDAKINGVGGARRRGGAVKVRLRGQM